jgi:hypothetical protein
MGRGHYGLLILVLCVAACGKKDDHGANVALSVTPNSTILGPGPDASCLDINAQAAAGTGAITRSVVGPVIRFNNFTLTWDSVDVLYVSTIRVTVQGAGISSGKFVADLASDEASTLIGWPQGIVRTRGQFSSTSPAAQKNGLQPCSFALGGVSLINGTSTPSFRARVTIDLIGTAESGDGTIRFVKQSVTGFADHISY